MSEFNNLVQYGLSGISLALVILIYYIIKWVLDFMENHIKENTKAQQELKDVIKELKEYLMLTNGKKKQD